jgi:hypothetical protein
LIDLSGIEHYTIVARWVVWPYNPLPARCLERRGAANSGRNACANFDLEPKVGE